MLIRCTRRDLTVDEAITVLAVDGYRGDAIVRYLADARAGSAWPVGPVDRVTYLATGYTIAYKQR